jgi:hypothetical protein
MARKILWAAALSALAALTLAGCATRVRFEADRTPALDTQGIQRVAVRPFQPADPSADAQAVASALTAEVTQRLVATDAFQLVDYAQVAAVRDRGGDISEYVDALFVGQVTRQIASVRERSALETVQRQQAEAAAGTISNPILQGIARAAAASAYPAFRAELDLAFQYYFVLARDGTMIGPIHRSGIVTRGNDNRNSLPGALTLANSVMSSQLRLFYRDVAPHTVRVTRTLESEPDRNLRPQMNAARELVRAGDHAAAHEAYLAIWEDHGSVAAAINASILHEVTGDFEDAIHFLEWVYVYTENDRVYSVIARLNAELAEQMGVAEFVDARPQSEIVAEHAIREVERALPGDARLWIHNNATAHENLANDVVDSMVYTFLNTGFVVVERQLVDLIVSEQNLHLEGGVNDSDFVSIGNLAGANTVVSVAVTGSGPARRLQVRVLDIETGTIRMQSGTGVAWRL